MTLPREVMPRRLYMVTRRCTQLVESAGVMHKLVYAATNPIKDRLVDKVHHWPGVNALAALLGGRSLHATRPRHLFRANGPMPATVTLNLSLPRELGEPEQLLAELRDRVGAELGMSKLTRP